MANQFLVISIVILSLLSITERSSVNGTEAFHLNQTNLGIPNLHTVSPQLLEEYINDTIHQSNGTIAPKGIEWFKTKEGQFRLICKVGVNLLHLEDAHWRAKYATATNLIAYNLGHTATGDNYTRLCYLADAINEKEAKCLEKADRTQDTFPRIKKSKTNRSALTESYCTQSILIPAGFFLLCIIIVIGVCIYIAKQGNADYIGIDRDDERGTPLNNLIPVEGGSSAENPQSAESVV